MTGHGHAQKALHNGRMVSVQVDSINKRGLECSISLPQELAPMEASLRQLVSEYVQRGKVSLSVTLTSKREAQGSKNSKNLKSIKDKGSITRKLPIHEPLLENYHHQLCKIAEKLGIKADLPISYLLSLPGVFISESQTFDEESKETILETARQALERMLQFRGREGAFLCRSLQSIVGKMRERVLKIEKDSPLFLERYRKQLLERINQTGLHLTIDDDRIAKEVVFFADRSDITEEITRLKAHLKEAIRILKSSETAGRTLEFLMQEIGREINTIGSKAAGLEISQQVIAFKAELEKIKEQVQNLE